MSTKVSYDNKQLHPAPFPTISTAIERSENGNIQNVSYSISLSGYILAQHGSPTTGGTFADLDGDVCEVVDPSGWTNAILAKYCHIHELFSEDYNELCIADNGYLGNITAYPRLTSISLDTSDENPQFAKYSIELESNDLFCGGMSVRPSGLDFIKSYDESWDFSQDRTMNIQYVGNTNPYQVTHNISANGIPQVNSGGIIKTAAQNAKEFVCSRIFSGASTAVPDNCILPSGIYGDGGMYGDPSQIVRRNFNESHSINEVAGSYAVVETWVATSGDYVINNSVTYNTTATDGCDNVGLTGNIIGFDRFLNGYITNTGFDYAKAKYDNLVSEDAFITIAETMTGITLDAKSESSSVSFNPNQSSVDYNFTFKQRPTRLVPSAKNEIVRISNNWDEDIVTTITILDRGEIVRRNNDPVYGYKSYTTTLSADLIFACDTSGLSTFGPRFHITISEEIQSLVDAYNPSNIPVPSGTFTNIFVESQNENWDSSTGAYSLAVTWKYNLAGTCPS